MGAVPKSNRKIVGRGKIDTQPGNKYMTTHFSGLVRGHK
jgi:hypothetical protein